MKKILLSILIVLMLAICCVTFLNGLNLFGLEIIGFSQIKSKSDQVDETIASATALASTDYKNTIDNIAEDLKKLKDEKKTYDDLVSVSEGNEVEAANQYQKYEIEYLWTQVGNHATSEGIDLQMDLVSGVGDNVYNLNFTVKGSYIGIADFIYDIENDSALGFKIESFNMIPGGGTETLQATFTCKNIEIKELAKDNTTNKNNQQGTNTTANNNNNTNTTNTTNTANTKNATNSTANNTSNSNNTSTTSVNEIMNSGNGN